MSRQEKGALARRPWAHPGIAGLFALGALGACQGKPAPAVETNTAALSSDVTEAAMGFESPTHWQLTQGSVSALQASTQRTNGTAALAFVRPSGYTRIESAALWSTNPKLAGLAAGAKVAIDINLPAAQANPYWFGAVQMYVSCPSRNINNAYMGQVELTGKRTGVFQTIRFALPDYAASALAGASFQDLTFGVVLNVPQDSPGTYLIDNLRLKDSVLPARPTSLEQIKPGQSSTLVAWKSTTADVADQIGQASFAQSVVQIPQSLHVAKGSAGTGTTTLVLSLTGGASTTCTFAADSTGANYVLASCSDGLKAGDLVPADAAKLTVNAADPNQPKTKIQVQLALNPADDEIVQGLPPIPTWMGESAEELAAALDAFVKAQLNWQIDDNVVLHLPTPAFNLYDSSTANDGVPPPAPGDTDPPFKRDGGLTNNNMADARWHLHGSIDVSTDKQNMRHTHFDNSVWTDIYLLGAKIGPLVKVTATVDATSRGPKATGSESTSARFCYEYLGATEKCKDVGDELKTGTQLFKDGPSMTFVDINWWIFHVAASGGLDVYANVKGTLNPRGLSLTFTPGADLWVKVEGGVAMLVAGGGLWGRVDLFKMEVPITVSASITSNTDPRVCTSTIKETLDAKIHFSALGGQIGYYIEGGVTCGVWNGLCWRDEETIFTWGGLEATYPIIPAVDLVNGTTKLPATDCALKGDADGGIYYPVAGQDFPQGTRSLTSALFSRTIPQDPPADWPDDEPWVNLPVNIDCAKYTWSSTDASDVFSSTSGCTPQITYGTPGPRTISVVAKDSALGTGVASVAVTVSATPGNPPVPQITSVATGNCSGSADGVASDPLSQDVTLSWYSEPSGKLLGTGASTSMGETFSGALRLVASAPDGRVGVIEQFAYYTCVK